MLILLILLRFKGKMAFTPEEAKIWEKQNMKEKEKEIYEKSYKKMYKEEKEEEWGFLNQE